MRTQIKWRKRWEVNVVGLEDANETGLFFLVGGWSCLACLSVDCLLPEF